MNKKVRSDSLAFKLALAFVITIAIQSILMAAVMSLGGVIEQSKENAFQIFSEKVNSRSDTLEGQMENVWTNFDLYTDELRRYFTDAKRDENGELKEKEELLKAAAPMVLNALYYTKTTGAFLILDNGERKSSSYSALYFRNANPNRSDERNSNTYLLAGPWSVAEETGVVTDADWSYQLSLTDENRALFEKPYSGIGLTGDERLLGYWSPPFQGTPGGEAVITYSVPLVDKKGEAVGVFGVEIAVNYLYKYLPSADLKSADSYGYIIGIRSGEDGKIHPLVTNGALQRRMLKTGEAMELETENAENHIFRLVNHNSKEPIYACSAPMGMYYNNTPFSGEEWYLIGLMDGPTLLEYPHRIKSILLYSFLISLCVGGVIAVFISKWFTRYSRLLELSEVPVGVYEMGARGNKVYMTNQVPGLLGLTREQERSFCRNQNKFREFLEQMGQATADEPNVFCLELPEGKRWIRLTQREDGEKQSGIVEDVTDEVLKTQTLEAERDYDGLTHVLNRKAFERHTAKWDGMLRRNMPLHVWMLDLNGLKIVNDRFGHDKGDEYIRFSAEAICAALAGAKVYRIGGDEFAAVFEEYPQMTVEESSRILAGQMEAYGQRNHFETGIAWGYAFSIPESEETFGELLARADKKMYETKKEMKKTRGSDK